MRTRVPGYAEEQDERSRIWWAEQEIRNAESKAKLDAYKARTTGHSQAVTSKPCHDCSCHVHPPCSACESCVHIDYPECPNDCQDCEEPHEY